MDTFATITQLSGDAVRAATFLLNTLGLQRPQRGALSNDERRRMTKFLLVVFGRTWGLTHLTVLGGVTRGTATPGLLYKARCHALLNQAISVSIPDVGPLGTGIVSLRDIPITVLQLSNIEIPVRVPTERRTGSFWKRYYKKERKLRYRAIVNDMPTFYEFFEGQEQYARNQLAHCRYERRCDVMEARSCRTFSSIAYDLIQSVKAPHLLRLPIHNTYNIVVAPGRTVSGRWSNHYMNLAMLRVEKVVLKAKRRMTRDAMKKMELQMIQFQARMNKILAQRKSMADNLLVAHAAITSVMFQEEDAGFVKIMADEAFSRSLLHTRRKIRHDTIAMKRAQFEERSKEARELLKLKQESFKETNDEYEEFVAECVEQQQLHRLSTIQDHPALSLVTTVVGNVVSPHLRHATVYSAGLLDGFAPTSLLPEACSIIGIRAVHFLLTNFTLRTNHVVFGRLTEFRERFGASARKITGIQDRFGTHPVAYFELNARGEQWFYAVVGPTSTVAPIGDWSLIVESRPQSREDIKHALGVPGKAGIRIACDMLAKALDKRLASYVNELKLQEIELYPKKTIDPFLASLRIERVSLDYLSREVMSF